MHELSVLICKSGRSIDGFGSKPRRWRLRYARMTRRMLNIEAQRNCFKSFGLEYNLKQVVTQLIYNAEKS